MDVVWKHSPVTARDVCDRLRGKRERAYTTIMTTMDRLHRKGLLGRQKDGIAWLYHPTMTAPDFSKGLAASLAAQILSANQDTALSAFVDAAADVDDALLDRLRHLIDARKKRDL